MKFYGKEQDASYQESVEVLDVMLRLLQSNERVFYVVETALREAGGRIFPIFNTFGPKEVAAAVAEAHSVGSTIATLEASHFADAAAEDRALGVASKEGEPKKV